MTRPRVRSPCLSRAGREAFGGCEQRRKPLLLGQLNPAALDVANRAVVGGCAVFNLIHDLVPYGELHPTCHHTRCDLQIHGVVGDGGDGALQAEVVCTRSPIAKDACSSMVASRALRCRRFAKKRNAPITRMSGKKTMIDSMAAFGVLSVGFPLGTGEGKHGQREMSTRQVTSVPSDSVESTRTPCPRGP